MSLQESRPDARPAPDRPLVAIADYVADYYLSSSEAFTTARYSLLDALGCALRAVRYPECAKHLGPLVPGAVLPGGARVPGTGWELDPAQAAYNIGVLVRWLDLNDCWPGAEWSHPSDNFGTLLAVADFQSRRAQREGGKALTIRDVLAYAIKAHEIQGIYALDNSFAEVGLDQVVLVRLASTAVATHMLGGGKDEIVSALTQHWIDNGPLQAYRHAPNIGERQDWAAGDACRRAVIHALNALKGCSDYPAALSAPRWGFYDAVYKGRPFRFERGFGSHVIENVLFKLGPVADRHAQTAAECALQLREQVRGKIARIARIEIETHDAALARLSKTGPLAGAVDRRHSLSYAVVVPLLFGRLGLADYGDDIASDPRIDALRSKATVSENPQFTREHLDPEQRAFGSAVQIVFDDGSRTERVAIDFPLGHRERRGEGIPLLFEKFEAALAGHLPVQRVRQVLELTRDTARFEATPVNRFMDLLVL